MKWRRLSTTDVERLLRDWEAGVPTSVLAERYGKSEHCVRMTVRYHGGNPRQSRASAADKEPIIDLCRQGLSDCEVSRRTGVPRLTVRRWRIEAKV